MIQTGKKIIVFGATGSIGQAIVKQALEKGYEVTAFVRNPAKFDLTDKNLKTFRGDVMDETAVEKALAGHDAVICALGAGSKGTIRSEGTRNIIRGMEKTGGKRLVCLSSLGVGDSRESLNFFWKYIMFGLLLRKAYADHEKQESYVRQSNLDWTIVRPAAFTDGNLTRSYKHGFPANDKTIKLKISRADVADFMLAQLSDNTYLRKSPGVSY